MEYSYKDVEFTKNTIIIHTEEKNIIIRLKEIVNMYYMELTFANFFYMSTGTCVVNILYVVKKDCNKSEDMIKIKYPYKKLVNIPRPFF